MHIIYNTSQRFGHAYHSYQWMNASKPLTGTVPTTANIYNKISKRTEGHLHNESSLKWRVQYGNIKNLRSDPGVNQGSLSHANQTNKLTSKMRNMTYCHRGPC